MGMGLAQLDSLSDDKLRGQHSTYDIRVRLPQAIEQDIKSWGIVSTPTGKMFMVPYVAVVKPSAIILGFDTQ